MFPIRKINAALFLLLTMSLLSGCYVVPPRGPVAVVRPGPVVIHPVPIYRPYRPWWGWHRGWWR
jgi:hypothetical protein